MVNQGSNVDIDGCGGRKIDISVILPVYNEQESIEAVLRELRDCMSAIDSYTYEIIAVNDGSTDSSLSILRNIRKGMQNLRIITIAPNSGQSAAFVTGFRFALGKILITMDADGQNDPSDISALLKNMESYDCCCGYRAQRKDSFSKKYGSKLANFVRNMVLSESIIDTGCSLKAFKAEFVEDIPMFKGMHRFLPSYMSMKGAKINQIPVNHRHRMLGVSKYTNFGRLQKTVWDLLAVRWMKKRYVDFKVEAEN